MNWLRRIGERVYGVLRKNQIERDMDEEIRSHIQMRTQDHVNEGMTPEDGANAARRRFGNTAAVKEACRDVKGGGALETTLRDVKYGVRFLRRSPAFAVTAILVLGLGIGAATTLFSVLNAVLLRDLPYKEPERLFMVWQEYVSRGWGIVPVSYPNFLELRQRAASFEDLGAVQPRDVNLTGAGNAARISAMAVSANVFSIVGIGPSIGRAFTPSEDDPTGSDVVMISNRLWQDRFGADPAVLGRTITLNGWPFTIIGVMPTGIAFPPSFRASLGGAPPVTVPEPELWMPLALEADPSLVGTRNTVVIGRLRAGATRQSAIDELKPLAADLATRFPGPNTGLTLRLISLPEQVSGNVRPAILTLFAATGMVLLIACSNVVSMLLARASMREGEMALRLAVGATRGRLIRQLVTESGILALAGGLLGLLFAEAAMRTLSALTAVHIPRIKELGLDARVLLFAVTVSAFAAFLLGMLPAFRISRSAVTESLRSERWSPRYRLRRLLVVGEIALAIALLVGAGLLVRSFLVLQAIDPGFHAGQALTMQLELPRTRYADAQQLSSFHSDLTSRLQALPGVSAVGITSSMPLSGDAGTGGLTIEERSAGDPISRPHAGQRVIDDRYFEAMGIPILRGRNFGSAETATSPGVAIINDTAARKFWPDQDPIGKRIRPDGLPGNVWLTIVGVVSDVRHTALSMDAIPEVYWPYVQRPGTSLQVVINTQTKASDLARPARSVLSQIDPDLPVVRLQTIDQVMANAVAEPAFYTSLLGIFSILALIMAATGLYGLMSFVVSQRSAEIGIRQALGASVGNVTMLILKDGVALVAVGTALGLLAAFELTKLMSGMLFGVVASDPLTYVVAPCVLAATALLACYLPARKALATDVMTALRHE